MYFGKDILEKVETDTLLKFWGSAVTAEIKNAVRDSSPSGSSLLDMLGVSIQHEQAQSVVDHLVSGGFNDFISRAPGIEPYFHRRQEFIRSYLEEVVTNVNAHEQQISRELFDGRTPTRVLSIDSAGFTYSGARSVLIINTDEGKFLYKPHPMRYSTVFNELCQRLLPDRVLVPGVIDCGNACLCEFVQSMQPASNQLNYYYEGLGGYLALAYFLSLTDQHAENILPVGQKFAPIDVETLFLAFPAVQANAVMIDDPTLSIRRSITSTMMLSYGHDRLIGSLIAGSKGKGITIPGTSTEAIEHLNAITKGFEDVFRRCLQNRQIICSAIRLLSDVELRILMGPGSFYQGLQSRFFELEGWDEAQRLQDLDRLLRSSRFKKANQAVCEYECSVLVEHDMPYFTIKGGGTDLLADGKPIWSDYLVESPVNSAVRHVKEASEADLEWQLDLLRKLVHRMPLMSKTRVPDMRTEDVPLPLDVALNEAGSILDQLFNDQIDCGSGRRAIMAFGDVDNSFGPMDTSLSWGYAGVGVFVAACKHCGVGEPQQAQELLDLCLSQIDRYGNYLKACPEILSNGPALGLKMGLAGHLRALQLMWSTTQDLKAHEIYSNLLSLPETFDFSKLNDSTASCELGELLTVLKHRVLGLPKWTLYERISEKFDIQSISAQRCDKAIPDQQHTTGSGIEDFVLQNCDNLLEGNAATVEKFIRCDQPDAAGRLLAAMVSRRHQVGNYVYKGAWRVPYFDPTLLYGATGIGYELLRYAKPAEVESLFL